MSKIYQIHTTLNCPKRRLVIIDGVLWSFNNVGWIHWLYESRDCKGCANPEPFATKLGDANAIFDLSNINSENIESLISGKSNYPNAFTRK
jgi:hypothetical protein